MKWFAVVGQGSLRVTGGASNSNQDQWVLRRLGKTEKGNKENVQSSH